VLSGGGLRGASHVGVLQELIEHEVPIDVVVGSSAGAVVAAYYAAVGLTVDELIRDARHFRGRHLLAHSLNVRLHGRNVRQHGRNVRQHGRNVRQHGRKVRLHGWLSGTLTKLSGIIPQRLAQLENATFERLHHRVRGIGVACHDIRSGRPCYFATGEDRGVRLSDAVRASASIPGLFPPIAVESAVDGTTLCLTDGGVSDCLPIAFAQRPPLSATHLIVSDCRWFAGRTPPGDPRIVYVRPRLPSTGTFSAPISTLASSVREGRRAVTSEILRTIRSWSRCPAT
jgi:NTE family protein